MEFLIGAGVAVGVRVFAMAAGFDRDRVFYAMLASVVATYYILFAAQAGSTEALVGESLIACAFLAAVAVGMRKNLWLMVAALAGHGVFDFFHHGLVENPAVPVWWPGFCGSFDVLAGAFGAVWLWRMSPSGQP